MGRHWQYLKYIVRHKWYVMMECFKHGLFWRGLMHDLSKFMPDEWIPYARHFYAPDGGPAIKYNSNGYNKCEDELKDVAFDTAWNKHIHRSMHHWQWYLLREDNGGTKKLDMPDVFIKEMVCDWIGAGKAQGYGDNTVTWYEHNKDKMDLSDKTRARVEELIEAWCTHK